MPVQPYVPSAYRADRVLLIGDNQNFVQRVDETIFTQDGETITAVWYSPTLNRQDRGFEFTLGYIQIFYSAASETTVTLTASGDGGNTWVAKNVESGGAATTTLEATTGQVRTAVAGFNVTGYDLRFKIAFTTNVAAKIFGYSVHLIRRGRLRGDSFASS